MRRLESDAFEPRIRCIHPSEIGWKPRSDKGPLVWETPDGRLYEFEANERLMLMMLDGKKDYEGNYAN